MIASGPGPARVRSAFLLLLVLLWLLPAPHGALARPQGAVASAHPLATAAGEAVLAEGGNAFDAAVAVAATLAVVEPYASGLGGGGFFLLHQTRDGTDVLVDARETAPAAAAPERFRGSDGRVDAQASVLGGRAAAIPGLPAGLDHLARRYGRLPLARTLAPAIALAREGFAADTRFSAAATARLAALRADARAAARFLVGGQPPAPGATVRQPELALTLQRLATDGSAAFYQGALAAQMVAAVRAAGGFWDAADLAAYRVRERAPQHIDYHGAHIVCASLPSAGGLTLAQALGILESQRLAGLPRVRRDHLVIEALRRAYQDRARYLGDPDFVTVPAQLALPGYARARAASIDPEHATASASLEAVPPIHEGDNTTHLSVVDAAGNRVAATLSINLPFGAALMAGDTGVLLNDEMDDFAMDPAASNAYGLAGSRANLVAPGRRPLSSMTPAFVEDARGVLVLGTPGGSRIVSMVLLAILEYVDGRQDDPAQVVAAARFHHQFLPDRVEFEPGAFDARWVEDLQAMGHAVQAGRRRWGNMQVVFIDRARGTVTAASDPRGRAGVLF